VPGTKVDVSEYGDGLHIAPVGRTARPEEHEGRHVAVAETPVTDDDVLAKATRSAHAVLSEAGVAVVPPMTG
jgi:hypothetical protein